MGMSSAQAQTRSAASSRSCCKVIPVAPVTMSTPPAKRVFSEAVLTSNTVIGAAFITTQRTAEKQLSLDRQSPGRSSQSILCTFLI